jgi:hypothetical protein
MSADFLNRLQEFAQAKLKGESYFSNVNCVLLRKLLTSSEVNIDTIYLLPSGDGKGGVGVIINMPTVFVADPEVPGPQLKAQLACTVIEERVLNSTPILGTGKTAEAVAMEILQSFHQLLVENLGTFYPSTNAIEPNLNFEGFVAFDVNLEMWVAQDQRAKVTTPTISIVPDAPGYAVTLTEVEGGTSKYYTLDGTFPGPGNAAAVLYSGTIPHVASGTTILWAGYKANYLGSDVWSRTL